MAQPSFSRPDRPSASRSMMNSRPKPVEPVLNSVGSSLPVPAPTPAEPFGDLQTTGIYGSPSPAHTSMRPPQQGPLMRWVSSPEPWNPLVGRNSIASQTGPKLTYAHSGSSFVLHRNHAPSSECDTIGPPDSGYGTASRTGLSVANGSIYEDCDHFEETASVASHSVSIPYDSMLSSRNWKSSASVLEAEPLVVNEDSNRLLCHLCNIGVKNKSELKKHRAKHEKPHRCKVPGCRRIEGFSTTNDLERHMRSRHPDCSSNGKYYKCGVPDCRVKEKVWPRADNFRQHLKRIHKFVSVGESEMEGFVFKPPPPPPAIASDLALAGLGSSIGATFTPVESNHASRILGPNDDWALYPQPLPAGGPREPPTFGHYTHQHVSQGTMAPEQHLMITAAATPTRDHTPMLQIQPVNFDVNTTLSHLGERSLDIEEGSGLISAVEDHSTDFHPISFDRSPILGHESVRKGDQSDTQDMTALTPSDAPCELPIGLTPRQQNTIKPTTDAITCDLQDDLVTLVGAEVDELSSVSTSQTSSSLGDTKIAQTSQGAVASQLEQCRTNESSRDDQPTDVKNKAIDLLTALEDKRTLADVLGRLDKTTLAEALSRLGYEKHSSVEAKGEAKAEANPNTNPSAYTDAMKNTCVCPEPDCTKFFRRECELRKHLKRHAKPYGCTFPHCHKSFGSKNDWKRHENSQHYQLELWQCNVGISADADETCGRTYNRREQFRTHLSKDHGITDHTTIESKLQSCLDGRNYEVSFWCGFCRKMVSVKEKGLKAWVSRINHIDQHFAEDLDISQWKSMETGVEVKVMLKEVDPAASGGAADSPSGSSSQPDSAARSLKRHVDEMTKQPRPQKKARASSVWYCCGCREQWLTDLSSTCLTPNCGGHEQCISCRVDLISVDPEA